MKRSFKELYQQAITPPATDATIKETVDPEVELLQQDIFKWKTSSVNVAYVSKVEEQIATLINDAVSLAESYHLTPNNPQQIINKLVQAGTLRKVVKDHVH